MIVFINRFSVKIRLKFQETAQPAHIVEGFVIVLEDENKLSWHFTSESTHTEMRAASPKSKTAESFKLKKHCVNHTNSFFIKSFDKRVIA